MDLFKYLFETFGVNEPIFFSDIQFSGYSEQWIAKQLAELYKKGNIIRFERGIYYIPIDTPFGKSVLNPNKVIERKYIMDKGETFGFYSGLTMLNQLGLITQVPYTIEICTNNEGTKYRKVTVGNQNIILRRSRVKINNDNLNVVRFLEIMNTVSPDFFNNERKALLRKWIFNSGISRDLVLKYSPMFPDKSMRNLIESELIFNIVN